MIPCPCGKEACAAAVAERHDGGVYPTQKLLDFVFLDGFGYSFQKSVELFVGARPPGASRHGGAIWAARCVTGTVGERCRLANETALELALDISFSLETEVHWLAAFVGRAGRHELQECLEGLIYPQRVGLLRGQGHPP